MSEVIKHGKVFIPFGYHDPLKPTHISHLVRMYDDGFIEYLDNHENKWCELKEELHSKTKWDQTFGEILDECIKLNSPSVSAWCKDNGFPQSTIQEYIKGTKKPGWEIVQKLADALDVSTEDLRG